MTINACSTPVLSLTDSSNIQYVLNEEVDGTQFWSSPRGTVSAVASTGGFIAVRVPAAAAIAIPVIAVRRRRRART